MGEKEKKRQIDKALDEYDERLETYYRGSSFDEEDMEYFGEELPFI